MTTTVASPSFVGREPELAHLTEVAARAAEGQPGFVLIGGESGVGKSRLVDEFAERAARTGARVLVGDCVDLGEAELPYAPWVAALRSIDPAEVTAAVGGGVRDLMPLLPQLGDEGSALGTSSFAQGRLFELLLSLLGGLGRERPLVVVIEDIHWADPSTRDFLRFLMNTRQHERVMVVATYRTDELHRRHPLRGFLAEADRARIVTRLMLERFTREELIAQLSGILGRPPSTQLAGDLFRRTEGNPFFTEELFAAGGETGDGRLPEDMRDALMLRIEVLGAEAQAVLRVAAAAGVRVRHALLAAAAAIDPTALVAGVREAIAHHVLVQEPDGDVYRFRHALLREALLDDLLPGERGPLHAALGRALASDPSLSVSGRSIDAELAAHWWAAHDLPAAFGASARAGADAERMAAWAEANSHFERAAELWDAVAPEQRSGVPDRVELLRRAAEAALLDGDAARATALARRALDLVADGDDLRKASLHERVGRYLWLSGASHEAVAELSVAVQTMPPDAPPQERAHILGADARLLMLLGRGTEARGRAQEALDLARSAGDRLEECRALNTLGPAEFMTGDRQAAVATLRVARALAEEIGDQEELTRSYNNLAETLDQDGRLADAVAVSRDGVTMARRERMSGLIPMLVAEHAARLVRLDGWDEAEAILPEAIDAANSGGRGRATALCVWAELQAMRGRNDDARRTLGELDRELREAVGSMWTAPVATAAATAALWDGRPADARAAVADGLSRREEIDDTEVAYLAPLIAAGTRAEAELAREARTLGDHEAEQAAVARADELHIIGGELTAIDPQPEAMLHVELAAAEAARAAGRAAGWAPLAGRWHEHGNAFLTAYCQWRGAEQALGGTGSRAEVADMLSAAHATARALRAEPLRREIDDLARRARIPLASAAAAADPTPPRPGQTTAERIGLTARELDVLQLLAGGATNREIAGRLYISQKTVTVHVTRILAKLDARTRVEAAGTAQRLGLLDPTSS